MRIDVVFTLTGPDRVGIVEEVTKAVLDLGGNVESSRMARLGGEFAVLMLVALPSEQLGSVDDAMEHLAAQGYRVTTTRTSPDRAETHPGWLPYRIEVRGADHEGIVHGIAHGLSQQGITVESMETGTSRAPNTGTPLFHMSALVLVPPYLPEGEWKAELDAAGRQADVDVSVAPAESE